MTEMSKPDRSVSLLTAEITQWDRQEAEHVVLDEAQAAELQACIDWYNERIGATADSPKKKHAFTELIVDKEGAHKVRVGAGVFNIVNWCVIFEDFKRRLGMKYHDPLRRNL